MRINTPPVVATKAKSQVFSNKTVQKPEASSRPSLATLAVEKLPISRNELSRLASDFKNGLIDREEANSLFVKTVINNSIRSKLGEKDREQLIHDIKEFFANDQDFVQKLAKNLSDFT